MAGIYLHIPFCKQACHYCDFHFSTSGSHVEQMVDAIGKEIALQRTFLAGRKVETIYFGGGTPSVLPASHINKLLDRIQQNFDVSPGAEITIEANPDDLTSGKVREFRQIPVNRFSIGVQSFFTEDLVWMNRPHNGEEAADSIKRVQDAGFENITIDLIYGFPLLTDEKWESNISRVINLQVPHVSCYSMTVEPDTALASFIRRGKQRPMDEEQSAVQFGRLMDVLCDAGFEHYEISNFAQPGKRSRHNSAYWQGVPYLGLGPSAHSFDGENRQWNVANNHKYIEAIYSGQIPCEIETLTTKDKLNEYIMTSLRTSDGLDLGVVSSMDRQHETQIAHLIDMYAGKNWIVNTGRQVRLTREGKLFADHIASELFIS